MDSAPTRRTMLSRFGKMSTTSVRRRISRLSRSCALLLQIWRECSLGRRFDHNHRAVFSPCRWRRSAVSPTPRASKGDCASLCFGVPGLAGLDGSCRTSPERESEPRDGLQGTENPRVGGSIPPLGTNNSPKTGRSAEAQIASMSSTVLRARLSKHGPPTSSSTLGLSPRRRKPGEAGISHPPTRSDEARRPGFAQVTRPRK